MRVLVLHSELGVLRGGGENFTRNLFTAFAARRHCVAAAFVSDLKRKYRIPCPTCIVPIPIPGLWSRNFGQASLAQIGGFIPSKVRQLVGWDRIQEGLSWRAIRGHNHRFARRVLTIFSDRWSDYDAAYVHGDTELASQVAPFIPTVLRLPGPVTEDRKSALRRIHAICANGDALLRIQSFLGSRVTELAPGVDTHHFMPDGPSHRAEMGWTEQERVIGYVGRLTQLKGVDLLASAFHALSERSKEARLLIIGAGEMERYLRTKLSAELSRGVARMIRDVPHEELPLWYRAMDLLVMPSRYENFSNAVLESLSCGIPVIASAVGGNIAIIGNECGWMFEPGSAAALHDCLRETMHDQSGVRIRGKMGRDAAISKHSWTESAGRLESIFGSIIAMKTDLCTLRNSA